jgi:hypothetical protein
MFKKSYPKHIYIPLIIGSLSEKSFDEILKEKSEINEFVKEIINTSPIGLYFKYLKYTKESISNTDNFDKCYLCFLMRKNKEFMKNFIFRKNYNFKYKMNLKKWKEVIKDAENLKMQKLLIGGGGEPFLEFNKLLKIFEFSSGRFGDIMITTNGFFANNEYEAINILKKFKKISQFTIAVSYDYHPFYKFHQSFVPEKNIINIMKAAKKLKINIAVNSLILKDSDIKYIYTHLRNLTKINSKLTVMKRKNLIKEDIIGAFKLTNEYIRVMLEKSNPPIRYEHFVGFLRINSRVQKRISNEDLIKLKPFGNEHFLSAYMHLRDIGLRTFQHIFNLECNKMSLILSNGIVINCGGCHSF